MPPKINVPPGVIVECQAKGCDEVGGSLDKSVKPPTGWSQIKGLWYCRKHKKTAKKRSMQNITVTCKFLSHYLINTLAVHFGGESVLDLVIPEPTPSKTSNSKNKYRFVLISNL